jgi:hypothetical protein
MTNIETLDLDDGVIARLDRDDARAYLETWRNPLRQASWIA